MFRDQETLPAARARLNQHATEASVKPPVHLLSDDGAPSDEVMAYCDRHRLTLDWVYRGAERKYRTTAPALVGTSEQPAPQSRQSLQDLASEVESLIGSAIATGSGVTGQDALTILEMAQTRARTLNHALDLINTPEGEAE